MCSVLYLYDIHKFCSQQLLDVQVKSSLLLVGDFELPSEVEFDYSEVKKKKKKIFILLRIGFATPEVIIYSYNPILSGSIKMLASVENIDSICVLPIYTIGH